MLLSVERTGYDDVNNRDTVFSEIPLYFFPHPFTEFTQVSWGQLSATHQRHLGFSPYPQVLQQLQKYK